MLNSARIRASRHQANSKIDAISEVFNVARKMVVDQEENAVGMSADGDNRTVGGQRRDLLREGKALAPGVEACCRIFLKLLRRKCKLAVTPVCC
jgi:hypothetical protein